MTMSITTMVPTFQMALTLHTLLIWSPDKVMVVLRTLNFVLAVHLNLLHARSAPSHICAHVASMPPTNALSMRSNSHTTTSKLGCS